MMPFPGGLAGIENGTILLSAVAALVYLLIVNRPEDLRRAIVKTLGVGLLFLLALIMKGPVLLAAALGLGAAGDFFLAFAGERMFLAGLVSFLAAHIAYIVLFAASAGEIPLFYGGEIWRIALLVLIIFHGVFMGRTLWRSAPTELRVPILLYIAAIIAMVAAALAWTSPIIVIGALLFAFSDSVLATERFLLPETSQHRKWTGPVVWITYYAAQITIALAYLT